MVGRVYWVVIALLAILLSWDAILATREYERKKKKGILIIHYILLGVLAAIVLFSLFRVIGLQVQTLPMYYPYR